MVSNSSYNVGERTVLPRMSSFRKIRHSNCIRWFSRCLLEIQDDFRFSKCHTSGCGSRRLPSFLGTADLKREQATRDHGHPGTLVLDKQSIPCAFRSSERKCQTGSQRITMPMPAQHLEYYSAPALHHAVQISSWIYRDGGLLTIKVITKTKRLPRARAGAKSSR